jgi:hypothetical protein
MTQMRITRKMGKTPIGIEQMKETIMMMVKTMETSLQTMRGMKMMIQSLGVYFPILWPVEVLYSLKFCL